MNGYEWLMASNGILKGYHLIIKFGYLVYPMMEIRRGSPFGVSRGNQWEIPELNEGFWCGNDLYCTSCKWGTFNCHVWLPKGKGKWKLTKKGGEILPDIMGLNQWDSIDIMVYYQEYTKVWICSNNHGQNPVGEICMCYKNGSIKPSMGSIKHQNWGI